MSHPFARLLCDVDGIFNSGSTGVVEKIRSKYIVAFVVFQQLAGRVTFKTQQMVFGRLHGVVLQSIGIFKITVDFLALVKDRV